MKKSDSPVSVAEKARRDRVFMWTVFVIIINAVSLVTKLWVFQAAAMIGTTYTLYKIRGLGQQEEPLQPEILQLGWTCFRQKRFKQVVRVINKRKIIVKRKIEVSLND